MMNSGAETAMVHFECRVCRITATCVHNAQAELAWRDHMANHVMTEDFDCWTWTAVQLPFD
jgi:hypothetical protein